MRLILLYPILILSIVMLCVHTAFPEPTPGDVFREYRWYNEEGDADAALRIGGRFDYGGGYIAFPHDIELDNAISAEMVVEKVLCHAGTKGLAVKFNDGGWIKVPESDSIPEPQWFYQHHIYPAVPIPLNNLQAGAGNKFKMRIEKIVDWPQALINGMHIRIYYEAEKAPHPTGKLTAPSANAELNKNVQFQAEAEPGSDGTAVDEVVFLGKYEDVNYEGDGCYYQWHYYYYHADLRSSIGKAAEAPWEYSWDTSWIPDQNRPMSFSAWIVDESGMTYMAEAITGCSLGREDVSVELCKPYNIPQEWVTRRDEFTVNFDVTGDVARITDAMLVWSSWSPGYMNGIFINGEKVFDKEGPRYKFYFHRVPIENTDVFKPGVNTLTTGKTPLYDGEMVHGMEVNWPGIMVLVRYENR